MLCNMLDNIYIRHLNINKKNFILHRIYQILNRICIMLLCVFILRNISMYKCNRIEYYIYIYIHIVLNIYIYYL